MEKGKIILIEGTDCSGKENQSRKLIEKITKDGIKAEYYSFPDYSSPTGKIVGLCYLGKEYLIKEYLFSVYEQIFDKYKELHPELSEEAIRTCVTEVLTLQFQALNHGWFAEGAPNVDSDVSSLLYAADRAYNIKKVKEKLDQGINIVLDRYTYSNMGHQAGKIDDPEERNKMYDWIGQLEFGMLELPQPDMKIFLHMPCDYTALLKSGRSESLDENEKDQKHLHNAERAFLEVAKKENFITIECIKASEEQATRENIRSIDDISEEIYQRVRSKKD